MSNRGTGGIASSGWFVAPRPQGSPRVLLLCFPHGGGSASTFNAWPQDLPAEVEVGALQLPGRGRRLSEAAATRIEQIVEPLLRLLEPVQPLPVALFGHSLGAWVAFELARRLQAVGRSITHLFVAGQPSPDVPDREAPIRDWPDGEFIAEVQRRYGPFPDEVLRDHEMMALVLPVLRADFTIKENYRYVDGPPLECPITALGGDHDDSASVDELTAWRHHTCSDFHLDMFPGGHFFVESARAAMLKMIAARLERMPPDGAGRR